MIHMNPGNGGVPKWLRERSAKPPFSGSNPLAASTLFTPIISYFPHFSSQAGDGGLETIENVVIRAHP